MAAGTHSVFWRFLFVGLATAALFYALLAAGVELLGLSATVASSLAYPMVLVFNYLAHFNWTFGVAGPQTIALGRYVLMIVFGFFLNAAVMHVGVTEMQLSYLLVQAVAMCTVIACNFVLSSLWVFRH